MIGIKESEKGWPSCVAFQAFHIAHRTRAVWLKFKELKNWRKA